MDTKPRYNYILISNEDLSIKKVKKLSIHDIYFLKRGYLSLICLANLKEATLIPHENRVQGRKIVWEDIKIYKSHDW